MDKSRNKFVTLIIFSILVLIIPILASHAFYFKNKVLWIFGSKENAYQYLQFIGTFLGVIITVLGAFIAIERQMSKDKELQDRNILKEKELQFEILKQQKEIDNQVKFRENVFARSLETQKSVNELLLWNLSLITFSESLINTKKMRIKSED